MSDDSSSDDLDDSASTRDRAVSALARLVDASVRERLAVSLAALLASLLVGGGIVLVAGLVATCSRPFLVLPGVGGFCYNPFDVYYQLFVSPFLSCSGLLACTIDWFSFALTLKETVLLLFTGLSVAVAFRAGLFNIGTQGQLVLGGLGTALSVLWIAPYAPSGVLGSAVLLPFGLLVGALVGGLYGAIPGALKAYADANEVITTIMLNFVATNVAFFLVATYFQDPNSQSIETRALPASAQLTPVLPALGGGELFGGSTFSVLALVGALGLIVGVYYLFFHTSFGYDLRTSGLQPAAALYGGVDANRMVVASMFLSGALGGVGGAVYVMMVLGRWRTGIPAIGFDGITVSILAGNHPLGVLLAAGLFGVLKSGSLSINFALGVPTQLVGVLRGLVILFVAMPEFFRMIGRYLNVSDRAAAPPGGGSPDEPTTDEGESSGASGETAGGQEATPAGASTSTDDRSGSDDGDSTDGIPSDWSPPATDAGDEGSDAGDEGSDAGEGSDDPTATNGGESDDGGDR